MSVLNKIVSYFPDISSTTNGADVSLLKLLQSNKHKQKILQLRSETDEGIQKQLKDKLPYYTVAGTFKHRSNEGLLQSSGLAAVDLDSAENYDVIHLLNELKKIPSIAYGGFDLNI